MSTNPTEQDELVRGIAMNGGARVVAARTTSLAEELRAIHDPSPAVTAALGRVATGALLLASFLEKVSAKEPVLTIEVEGNGPAGKLMATASPSGWVRGLVKNPAADMPPRPDGKLDVGGVVGHHGTFSVARDLGFGQPYRGVVPLVSGEIGIDLAHYLRDSEQKPTAVALGVFVANTAEVRHAGGLIVQLLPGVSEDDARDLEQRMIALGDITRQMRAGAGPTEWLGTLFPGGYELTDRMDVRFRCGCSMDRVERALKLVGPDEIAALLHLAESRPATVTCEFCRTVYTLDRGELARLLLEAREEQRARRGGAAAADGGDDLN